MRNRSKILLVGLVAAVAGCVPAMAQQHQSRSFLNFTGLYLTNAANATNLSTAGSVGTNFVGVAFTNLNNRVVINTTSDSTNVNASRLNPFKDVSLWALKDGGPAATAATNGIGFSQGYATISVTMTAGSGADSAIPFVFTPIYNGVNEATASTEEWTAAFTPTASSTVTLATNVPLHRWPGAAKLRLRRAVNSDTTAAGHVIVTDISLNGFPP